MTNMLDAFIKLTSCVHRTLFPVPADPCSQSAGVSGLRWNQDLIFRFFKIHPQVPWYSATSEDIESKMANWSDSLIFSQDAMASNCFALCSVSSRLSWLWLSSLQARISSRIFFASAILRALASWSIKEPCRFMSSRILSNFLPKRPQDVRNIILQPGCVREYHFSVPRTLLTTSSNELVSVLVEFKNIGVKGGKRLLELWLANKDIAEHLEALE